MIKRALISVSDKTGIVELAQKLNVHHVEIISTGGTAKVIQDANIPVIPINTITDFPECLEGRVKTLHPKIHGGILAKRANTSHQKQAKELGIEMIDLVVVNLYPFEETILQDDYSLEDAIENIDIGGVALIRAAAKNYNDVLIITDPKDYQTLINALDNQTITPEMRLKLAAKAFQNTAYYDTLIGDFLTGYADQSLVEEVVSFPEQITLSFEKVQELRYGENPHQKAAYYKEFDAPVDCLAHAKQIQGKELSFNNINDTNAAIGLVQEFDEPTVVALKHTNPCGVGSGETIFEAYTKAYEADPISIFGGIVALNQEVDEETAQKLKEIFLEVIIAPAFSDSALKILKKKKNLRLLELKELTGTTDQPSTKRFDMKRVKGGLLIQDYDDIVINEDEIKTVTQRQPTPTEMEDLLFAWKVVKHTKSNAIVIAKNKQTLGIGIGQTSRVWAAEIAVDHSQQSTMGSVMASDAFFPFKDTAEMGHKAGVSAIIQPGGSKNDQESIDFCNANEIAMIFTGIRHFKH